MRVGSIVVGKLVFMHDLHEDEGPGTEQIRHLEGQRPVHEVVDGELVAGSIQACFQSQCLKSLVLHENCFDRPARRHQSAQVVKEQQMHGTGFHADGAVPFEVADDRFGPESVTQLESLGIGLGKFFYRLDHRGEIVAPHCLIILDQGSGRLLFPEIHLIVKRGSVEIVRSASLGEEILNLDQVIQIRLDLVELLFGFVQAA